jgi:hypothetical protein
MTTLAFILESMMVLGVILSWIGFSQGSFAVLMVGGMLLGIGFGGWLALP